VHLVAADDLGPVPRDIAICVYRIVQEGLRNVVNHAGVGDAHVTIERHGDQLEIQIVDGGCGFDPDARVSREGLGLLSVEERARLVGGSLSITAAPGRGTALQVSIPVSGR
jgi:signal transduction histidine kinase